MVGGTALEEMNTSAEDTVSLIRHDGEQSEPISSGYNLHRKRNRGREVRMIIVACLVFGIAVTAALIVDIYTGHHHTGHAAVVSDVKECADVGLDLIKKGGSATDAAIGAMLCVGVMNPESSGLGGGGFMLTVVPKKDKEEAEVIDFREVAPQAATKDMFKGNGSLVRWGGLSVAVPGEIKGFELAHKKSGKLKWSEVFEPAIKLAKEGFKVTAHTGRVLRNLPKESLSTKLKEMILDPQGKPLKEGDIMRNPALAETLQNIADHGADVLYRGPIAEKIVAAVTSANGILTSKDLSDYKPLSKAVINSTYLGYQVITTPLPSGGPVLVSLLNILEGFNFTNKDQGKSRSYHYIIEAIKFAFAQRSLLEDGNVTKIVNQMLSKEHAKSLREKISPNKTFNESYYGPMFGQAESHGTAHVSVIGPDGELVSVTSSINEYFGSGIMTENGIILNNEMADFSIPGVTKVGWDGPPKANFIVPGRRPLSSCVPTVVLHKEKRCWFRMSLGASGGMYITPSVAEVLVSYLAFNMSLKNSIERPRVFFNINTGTPEIEADKFEDKEVASSIKKDLRNMGHDISQRPALTDVNGLSYFKENVSAHADSRRGGEGSAQF